MTKEKVSAGLAGLGMATAVAGILYAVNVGDWVHVVNGFGAMLILWIAAMVVGSS